MRVSLNWLREYVDIDLGVDELAHKMTMLGLEIEAIERPGAEVKNVFVGQILSIDPHPNADKLVVCKTDVGQGEPKQIVCGASNMKVGDKVPTAVVGATLAGGFEITGRKLRGVESQGMMCSAQELGVGEDHSGLLILDPGTPVGGDALALLGLDDVVFEVEVTPNRGDWASMIGIARELAALFDTAVRIPVLTIEEDTRDAAQLSSVTIENPDLCPRYIGRILTDVKIGPSPQWMCTRLIAAGLRPISNVVDITNYVLMETGHPLHAFDCDLLKENRIVVRTARPGESITSIDGEVRELTPDMLIIADADAPVAIAGIMGGQQSEVGEKTTTVFLESAYFNPVSIRRTSRALGMQTEASMRFQRGADPEMALYAGNRAAMLMQQLAGAKVAKGLLDEYPKPFPPKDITLRYARTDLLLGTEVPRERQPRIMKGLGFEIIEKSDESCRVRVPSWRYDVSQEADLIEEIARFHNYDNIDVNIPAIRQSEQVFAPRDASIRALRRFLAGQGLTEFFNWTFSCPADVRKCGLADEYLNMVALSNPLSENHTNMRSSLIPGLIATVSSNVRHGNRDILGFELGPVYVPNPDNQLPDQLLRVALVLSGHDGAKHWSHPQQPLDFYDLKGYCEALLDYFEVDYAFQEAKTGTFKPGECASIVVKEQTVAHLGEVHTPILEAYDIDQSLFLAEFDLQFLLDLQRGPVSPFEPIPAFPPSLRDMAVLVDAALPAGDLRDLALQTGGKHLKSVDIFDIYTGKQVPEGKKSIALSLVFQSDSRTLTDKDTQKAWDKILKKLQARFGAELR